ncbi:MAG: hypothetical protein E7Z63_05425 [Thermoplasmata archaeon]|nr:hypothetical protein [Thermoplasmata archaeon]
MTGASNIYGSGMLSLGMSFSKEQLVIDNDIIKMIRYASKGVAVDEGTMAYDTICEVGIGNDFLSCNDTLGHVDNPSKPRVLNRDMRPNWETDGKKDTVDYAHEIVTDILENHVPEPLSDYALQKFDEIIARAEARMAEETKAAEAARDELEKKQSDSALSVSVETESKKAYAVTADAATQADFESKARECVNKFDVKGCVALANDAISKGVDLVSLIVNGFTAGINDVGKLYGEQKVYLPQMMAAAAGMNNAIDVMKPYLAGDSTSKSLGNFVICTIEGDIHSIGKDICAIMLSVGGFNVINLGRDVPLADIAKACEDYNAIAVGTSALMTSTMVNQKTLEAIMAERGLKGKCLTNVGGAPVSQQWADEIGADIYSENSSVIVEKVVRALKSQA